MTETAGILIVEDRAIIAAKIKRELQAADRVVARVAATRALGLRLANTLPLAAAILDLDLRGEASYPIAEALRRRAIPFVFLTGYSHVAVMPAWQEEQHVEKPFDGPTLIAALNAAIANRRSPPVAERVITPTISRTWDRVRHMRDLLTEQRAWAEERGLHPKAG